MQSNSDPSVYCPKPKAQALIRKATNLKNGKTFCLTDQNEVHFRVIERHKWIRSKEQCRFVDWLFRRDFILMTFWGFFIVIH
jgi:hypothetical protein